MNLNYPIRNSVRIILLNDQNELLLMCIDDPRTKQIGEEYKGRFWTLAGGEIENGEDIEKTAIRELAEETGLSEKDIELGPVVWTGELDLILYGKPTHIKEKYIVARTKKKDVSITNLTEEEIGVVKELAWFSLNQITNSKETIFPTLLSQYLPDIIKGDYPKKPLEIVKEA